MRKINIAIDGYAGCGKSTTAKLLAEKLGYIYIDTGAMYRAVTLYFIEHQIDEQDTEAVATALETIRIDLVRSADGSLQVLLNQRDVSSEIRTLAVNNKVSAVSAIKAVRANLVAQQQQIGRAKGVVMDGRDIGTVVFPDAELKLFMQASIQARAERRLEEMQLKGEQATFEEVSANLSARDQYDSNRKESPLRQADDAILLDTSDKTIEQQLQIAYEFAQKCIQDKAV